MNFEFPLQELPAVMRGPRVERRRVLVGGSAYWGTIIAMVGGVIWVFVRAARAAAVA